ncbi:MAG: SDR family NAD(P)-dependent oxidoreductase [Myxococcales bacterium]
MLAAREARATLEAIKAAGGDALYAAADTRDRAALDSAIAQARRWGPITALVHGAGVLADKRLAEKTDEAFDSVFDTKVQGLDALLAVTSSDPLEVVCLFSSVAARTGNVGQADYAAANEVLNKRAALESRLRGKSCRVVSIGWGPWDGGMVDAGLRARFASLGVPLIPLASGAEAFADELLSASQDREITLGGLPPVPTSDGVRFDVSINHTSHPQLLDHAIDDVPVLPFVQVLEYFARAARAAAPDQQLVACRDLRLLRGVKLDRFDDGGTWLSVVGQRASPQTLELELRGRDGTLHYAATADLAPKRPEVHAPPPPPPPALTERFAKAIYGGQELFHGPRFQVVRDVEGVSAEGIVGTLTGTRERGWQGSWQTDAAALDGGLQLALLWSGHVMGGRSLPTSIGEVRTYQPGTADGPLRCTLRGHLVGDSHATSDIALVDQDGALVCEMRGVETIRRPDPAQGS